MQHHRRYPQCLADEQLRPGTVRNCKIRTQSRRWCQLKRPPAVVQHLQKLVLAVSTNNLAGQLEKLQKLAHLLHVARGQNQFKALVVQLLDDWQKKWDMGRIVDIDPDLLPCPVFGQRPVNECRFLYAGVLLEFLRAYCHHIPHCLDRFVSARRGRGSPRVMPNLKGIIAE